MQYRKTILKTCDCVVRKGKLKVLIFVFTLKGSCFITANMYLFKVNNRISRKRCEIC